MLVVVEEQQQQVPGVVVMAEGAGAEVVGWAPGVPLEGDKVRAAAHDWALVEAAPPSWCSLRHKLIQRQSAQGTNEAGGSRACAEEKCILVTDKNCTLADQWW